MNPAPPSASRAIIVGLEKYKIHTLHGALPEALTVAATLRDLGVLPERIDLWRAPADAHSRKLADDSGFPWREFTDDTFIDYMLNDIARDTTGGTLYFHWCGHGLAKDKKHHLLLPSSQENRLESLELAELSSHLVDDHHQSFAHIVYVVDTCRESSTAWGQIPLVPRNLATTGHANGPVYCTLFVCAEGQTTTFTANGSAQGSTIRTTLKQAAKDEWPDFLEALRQAAGRLQLPDGSVASPYVRATDWVGQPLCWSREASLDAVFGSVAIDFSRQAELAYLSLRPESKRQAFTGPSDLVSCLADLPRTLGVEPLHEFACRLLDESAPDEAAPLRAWAAKTISATENASIRRRIATAPEPRVLMLWADDDPDAGGDEPSWKVMAALCDARGVPIHLPDRPPPELEYRATGRAGLRKVLHTRIMELMYGKKWKTAPDRTGAGKPDIVELFLPASLVPDGLERESLDFEDECLDLFDQFPTVIRNGRHLATARDLWLTRGPQLLERWAQAKPLLRQLSADPRSCVAAFLRDDGPVWCLVPDATASPKQLAESHRFCIKNGLPALAWLGSTTAPLPDNLKFWPDDGLRAPSGEVARRLVQLRRAGLAELTVMFDDPARPARWHERTGQTSED